MNETLSVPAALVDLVRPPMDAVVSRVLFRNAGGTVTVFAFGDGVGLDEHTNPNDALIHVLEGECTVRIRDTEHRAREGEMLHLPASVPHAIVGGAPFRMLLLLLRPDQER